MTRTHTEWRNRVMAEYTSAALTAQVLHWMIQSAMPDELLNTALRIVRDELDHAALCHECLLALGGSDLPAVVDASTLAAPPAEEGVLASLADSVLRNFCLGETFAVPLFAAMREGASHPAARRVLDRVLRDEAVHRAFGWAALDALLAREPEALRARAAVKVPRYLRAFHAAYAHAPTDSEITDEEVAAGLLSRAGYAEVHISTVETEILPRFARRGINW